MDITQEYLKEYFYYEGGYLIRKKNLKILGWPGPDGYVRVEIFGKAYLVHRLIWLYHYGYLSKEIDHINGVRTDNRIENLREVSSQENSRNQKKPKNNKSGFIGISYSKRYECWVAHIAVNYKSIHLGYFKNIEDAILARKEAEVAYKFHKNHGRD